MDEGIRITYTTMIQTDGRRTVYGVYHATLHWGNNDRPSYVNLDTAERIATETIVDCPWPDLLAMARRYASSDYPPFAWPESVEARRWHERMTEYTHCGCRGAVR